MTVRLHDNLSSENGYKVRLLLAQLGISFERIEYDITSGETRTPEFLEKVNGNERIPVLETEEGEFLPESNAILFYLAEGTPLLPDERLGTARVCSSAKERGSGLTASAKRASTAASIRSVLASLPVALAKSLTCLRLTIATGTPARARAAAAGCSSPPVASTTASATFSLRRRRTTQRMPRSSLVASTYPPLGRGTKSKRSLDISMPA